MGNQSSSSSSEYQRETATVPGYGDTIETLQYKLNEAEELHKKRCEDLLINERKLKSVQQRNFQRIKDMEKEIKDANNINPTEIESIYNNRIKEMNERKDKELADSMDHFQTVVFPEKFERMKQEVLEKVQSLRDNHWEERLKELEEMEKKDIEIIKKIARSEHDNALKKVKRSFQEEVEVIEDKILEKRKRNGILSWFIKPSSKSKKSRKDDYDDDDDNDDDYDDDDDDE
jgi:hypothetical protein